MEERGAERDRIREAVKIAVAFHILIFVPASLVLDGGELAKIALFAMIPFWAMVGLIAWKRGKTATRIDYALIGYSYPLPFGGYFLWNAVAE